MKGIGIICFLYFVPVFLLGQNPSILLSIDKDSVTIGEVISISAVVQHEPYANLLKSGLDELSSADTWDMLGSVVLMKGDTVDANGDRRLVVKESFDALVLLDEGWLEFGPVTYQIQYRDSIWSVRSSVVKVFVVPVVKQGDVPSDLKSIIEESMTFKDYVPWLVGFLILISAVFLFLYLRKYEVERKPILAKEPPIPPLEKALTSLRKLKKEKEWIDNPKLNQVQLSKILRTYLEEDFRIPALENTTNEINNALKKNLSLNQRSVLMKILNDADMVKFAKLTMPIERQEHSIEEAIRWVKNNSFE